MLVRYASHHLQHMQKALEQMNLKLTEVVSSIAGVTGMAILGAILAGERDPKKLAALRHEKCARPEAEIARALEGTWQPEHLLALRHAHGLYHYLHGQVAECDARIAEQLDRLPDRRAEAAEPPPPRPRRRGRKPNDLRFDAAAKLSRALGVDLTAIEGIDATTATVILAEVGASVDRFPSEKHFASWLGLCPRTATSNKTKLRRSPRPARTAWARRCAWRRRRPGARRRRSARSTAGSRAGSAGGARSRRRRTSCRGWCTGCSSTAWSTRRSRWSGTRRKCARSRSVRCGVGHSRWGSTWWRGRRRRREVRGREAGAGRGPADPSRRDPRGRRGEGGVRAETPSMEHNSKPKHLDTIIVHGEASSSSSRSARQLSTAARSEGS